MANPNILNITTVSLSSNSIQLPSYTADATTYSTWNTGSSRLLLTNPVGSNKLFKITSMIGEHAVIYTNLGVPVYNTYTTGLLLNPGVSVFTTNAGLTGSKANVLNYIHGANEHSSGILVGGETTSGITFTKYSTFGPPNHGSPSFHNSAGVSVPSTGNRSYIHTIEPVNKSLICSPTEPFYLTEGNSLHAVSRIVWHDMNNNYYYSGQVNIMYSYEEIS